jgi:uronate dehydrogenase
MIDHQATSPPAPLANHVLLTGAAGKLARRLRPALAARYRHLTVTDLLPLAPVAGNERAVACDLRVLAQVEDLMEGVEAVVHFAGYPREADWDTIVGANLVTTANVFEAAQRKGVRRIVYASSNHVIGFHGTDRRIGLDAELKADSRYGVSKVFAETVARFYYEKFGMTSLGLRIGRCEDRPLDPRMLSTWLHPEDLVQLVVLGLDRPVRADVIYGVSRNARSWWDNAGQAVPYEPAFSADDFPLPAASAPAAQPSRYQGGPFAEAGYVGDPERAAAYERRSIASDRQRSPA